MSLSWGHPAMLAGLALIALPIIAHLTGTGQVQRVMFPALRFLGLAQQAIRRRRMLEDLLLLAVRVAAIVALALLFARPQLMRNVAVQTGPLPPTETVIVLDRSMSTQARVDGGTVFETIIGSALQALEQIPADVPVAVVLMDHRAIGLGAGLAETRGDLIAALADLEPGHGATDLDDALGLAVDMLERAGAAPGHVLVLGDGTASGLVLQRPGGWPDGLQVTVRDLSGGAVDSAYVRDVRVDTEADPVVGLPVEVDVAGHRAERGLAVDVELQGMSTLRGTLAAGETTKRFTAVEPPPGLVPGVATIEGDDLPADDRFPFLLRTDRRLRVYLLGGAGSPNPRDDELYYLTTALRPQGDISVLEPVVIAADDLADLPASPGTVVVLCNVPTPGRLVPQLERLVSGGAGVLVAVGDLVDRESYEALSPLLPARIEDVKSRERSTFEATAVGLATPDLAEPLWAPFREGGVRTFERARFDRVMEVHPALAPDSDVLLRYTDGRAALLQRRVGRGRVLLFTSTLDDDWTDLPLRGIYLPMVHQTARYLAGELNQGGGSVHLVGQRVELQLSEPAGTVVVVGPDGRQAEADVGVEGLVVLSDLEQPGFTTIHRRSDDGTAADELWQLCVRIDPAESALTALDRTALDAVIPGVVFQTRGGEAGGESGSTVVRRSSLTIPILLGLVAALAVEILGGRRR